MANALARPEPKDAELDKFFKSLTDAQWDEAEAIEAELCAQLSEGLPEYEAAKFVQVVMTMRKVKPDATVEGVFTVALRLGLTAVPALLLKRAKRKSRLSGKGF